MDVVQTGWDRGSWARRLTPDLRSQLAAILGAGVTAAEAATQLAATLDHFRELLNRRGGALDLAGCKVLDIGCGFGCFEMVCAERGYRVIGVDIDLAKLEIARRLGPDTAGYAAAAGEQLPFIEGTFDRIVNLATIDQVASPPLLLGECLRVLRPGGRLFVGAANHLVLRQHGIPAFVRAVLSSRAKTRQYITPRRLCAALVRAGFEIEVDPCQYSWRQLQRRLSDKRQAARLGLGLRLMKRLHLTWVVRAAILRGLAVSNEVVARKPTA